MLTTKQEEVLTAIKQYIENENISPTVRDIGNMIGLSSTSTVQKHLDLLEQKGYIKRRKETPRSISILK
jgi:SOS-response transcriptional repressor LexA